MRQNNNKTEVTRVYQTTGAECEDEGKVSVMRQKDYIEHAGCMCCLGFGSPEAEPEMGFVCN